MKKLCLLLALLSLLLAACGSVAPAETEAPQETTEETKSINWGNVPVISTTPGCGMETVPNVE